MGNLSLVESNEQAGRRRNEETEDREK